MTEKRFRYDNGVWDNNVEDMADALLTEKECCDLLNEQHEQLQTQKHIIDKQEMRIKELLDELYCKDRKLEELGVDIECCDKK